MAFLLNMDIENIVRMMLVRCVPPESIEGPCFRLSLLDHEHPWPLLLFLESIRVPCLCSGLDLRSGVHDISLRSFWVPTSTPISLKLRSSHAISGLQPLVLVNGGQDVPD